MQTGRNNQRASTIIQLHKNQAPGCVSETEMNMILYRVADIVLYRVVDAAVVRRVKEDVSAAKTGGLASRCASGSSSSSSSPSSTD